MTHLSNRRRFLQLSAGTLAAPIFVRNAFAQTYPARPVKVMVGFAAGGATDVCTRIAVEWLGQKLGQPFVVENRTGAGSNIAAQAAIASQGDGYTLLASTASNAVNATYYPNLPFNIVNDTVPIGGVVSYPLILVISPSLPVKTIAEFIAYTKANPGKVNIGSFGSGTSSHLTGELFKTMTGVAYTHIPYRGEAAALPDIIAGQVQGMFCTPSAGLPLIRDGKIRAIGVSTAKRFESLPDVPPIGDTVQGFDASSWVGLSAPKGTPAAIVERVNQALVAGLEDASLKSRYGELGVAPMPMAPAAYGKLMADEVEKWGKVVKLAGIKAE
ncbi:tripartite tricarboxylate transporter family receptor [Variibacter gotjawalensis]|uniref:Tripartite tricarboxylate transporter family receptor n=1 Tax=Variibacter gotjawalensis TaxID=1333996 RepID=A0A0S3PR93_9BRAD|nr:tripartite tricarboxylate transporter substrate binding protein [Variibacter gotjawalensis]NIK48778.1 tripartite-type tricarboxylate transporter receptor subunit TctC [Variibacter gotjawalensis]RZS50639.1 tripartite-type tricarboxylate transporter receptor subunit TctC [Variibacter gotjawalensis]BAT58472.1 tripartite tricarboxylate transporter family receptor [Variibacter gotjawalensis]